MKKIVWMCAGQGTQFYQMGRELYEGEPVFRACMEEGDRIAAELLHVSLLDIIYRPRRDRFEPFRRLLFSHPSLFLFECAMGQMLLQRGLRPDYLLGHSLGEFGCLVLAGTLPLAEALVNVIKQAELFEYCAPKGGMLVVLESIELMEKHPEIFLDCTLAARNFSRNFIISARREKLPPLHQFLRERQINFLDLPVDYAFHSADMDVVKTPCLKLLEQLSLGEPALPIVSAQKEKKVQAVTPAHLWEAIRQPIDFERTIRALEKVGSYLYIDLSPSGSMATALKYILPRDAASEFMTVSSPFGQERKNLERVLVRCQSAPSAFA